jgi:signal transduction histidine kinase
MDRRVTGELVSVMVSQRMYDHISAFLFSVAAVTTLWPVVDHWMLFAWFVGMMAPALLRETILRSFQRTSTDIAASSHPRWAHRICLCAAINGILWGSVAGLLPSAESPQIAMLIGLHVGYIALSSGLLAAYLPAFYAFASTATLVFVSILLLQTNLPIIQFLLTLVALTGACIAFAHRSAGSLAVQIRLRLESDEKSVRHAAERDQSELAMLAKNQFLSAASHDLRQPVHAIGLFAGLLEVQLRDQDTGGILGKIQQSISALSSLFDRVLDISRLDAGAVENVPQHVTLDPLLHRIKCEHDMQARAKRLSLTIDCQSGLTAFVDPTLLERVLMNIVSNAIKYTYQGSVDLTVRSEEDRLSIVIKDTGRGISDSEKEQVFSEYHQLRKADRDRSGGQGLGLAIVKRLCKLMEVPIDLVSAPGIGTEFSLSLACGDRRKAKPEESADLRHCDKNLWCQRALVVDGEQDILDGMRQTLASWGCRATTARTIAAALKEFSKSHRQCVPDVLILDSSANIDISTHESIRAVREEYNVDIPVLLVTGHKSVDDLQELHEPDVCVLRKPLPPGRLYEALAGLSKKSRQSKVSNRDFLFDAA